LWAAGALVSNLGTWVQRTAQDWLVLTELTRHSAAAVGIVMGLQFGPQLLFLPWIGVAADYFDRRKLLMVTQGAMGVLALILGLLTLTGMVRLWHVYAFAFLFGTAAAFDAPARQTFVADLVGDDDLANAVALNSTSFNAARTVGPAIAGLSIASWGTGWSFVFNGASYFAVLATILLLRRQDLAQGPRAGRARGKLSEGLRYIASRNDLRAMMAMLFLIGTLALNFPIFISTMSVTVFHAGAGRYGLLTSAMAIGTMVGSLLATGRDRPSMGTLTGGAALLGIGLALAAIAPSFWWFGAALLPVGIAALTFTNSSNTLMQLATEPAMRGRVIAIRLAVMSGVTLVGAPIVGMIADRFGPRYALILAALSGLAAAMIGLRHLRTVRALASGSVEDPGDDEVHTA